METPRGNILRTRSRSFPPEHSLYMVEIEGFFVFRIAYLVVGLVIGGPTPFASGISTPQGVFQRGYAPHQRLEEGSC